jgi:predicted TIM-barrel fold metal-dependent hydrolase
MMEIIDAQVHLRRTPLKGPKFSPDRPISNDITYPIDAAVAAMEAVGVSGAVVDGGSEDENRYAIEAAQQYPGQLGPIAILDVAAKDITERVQEAKNVQGMLGARAFVRTRSEVDAYWSATYDPFLRAAQSCGLPVFILGFRHLDVYVDIANRFPTLQIIVDHVGMPQPPWEQDDPPLAALEEVMKLSSLPNVALKLCGMPTYSRQQYPYHDIWPALHRIVDGFGTNRVMWASDLSRLFGLFTYADLLGYILHTCELSVAEKSELLGGAARRVLQWKRLDLPPRQAGWRVGGDLCPPWLEN